MEMESKYDSMFKTKVVLDAMKQEYICRYPTDVVSDLRAGIGRYMELYNELRPDQSLGNATPPSKIYRIKDKAA